MFFLILLVLWRLDLCKCKLLNVVQLLSVLKQAEEHNKTKSWIDNPV